MSTNFIARYQAIEQEREMRMDAFNAWHNDAMQKLITDFKAHYGLSVNAVVDINVMRMMYTWCEQMENKDKGLAAIEALVNSLR